VRPGPFATGPGRDRGGATTTPLAQKGRCNAKHWLARGPRARPPHAWRPGWQGGPGEGGPGPGPRARGNRGGRGRQINKKEKDGKERGDGGEEKQDRRGGGTSPAPGGGRADFLFRFGGRTTRDTIWGIGADLAARRAPHRRPARGEGCGWGVRNWDLWGGTGFNRFPGAGQIRYGGERRGRGQHSGGEIGRWGPQRAGWVRGPEKRGSGRFGSTPSRCGLFVGVAQGNGKGESGRGPEKKKAKGGQEPAGFGSRGLGGLGRNGGRGAGHREPRQGVGDERGGRRAAPGPHLRPREHKNRPADGARPRGPAPQGQQPEATRGGGRPETRKGKAKPRWPCGGAEADGGAGQPGETWGGSRPRQKSFRKNRRGTSAPAPRSPASRSPRRNFFFRREAWRGEPPGPGSGNIGKQDGQPRPRPRGFGRAGLPGPPSMARRRTSAKRSPDCFLRRLRKRSRPGGGCTNSTVSEGSGRVNHRLRKT